MAAERAAQAVRAVASRAAWYRRELRALAGQSSFSRDAEGVDKHGDDVVRLFAGGGAGSEDVPDHSGGWHSYRPRSVADEAYGRHVMLFRPPLEAPAPGEMAPAVALVSHLDTVYPSGVLKEHGHSFGNVPGAPGWIRGPGVMDCKGGTLAARAALDVLRECHPDAYRRCAVHVWLNAAEEPLCWDFAPQCARWLAACGGRAAGHPLHASAGGSEAMAAASARLAECEARCVAEGAEACPAVAEACPHDLRACFVLEAGVTRLGHADGSVLPWASPAFDGLPGAGAAAADVSQRGLGDGPGVLVVSSRQGMLVWRVRLEGRAAHSGNAHASGRSAVLAAARVIVAAEAANQPGCGFTINVGRVEGGTTHNTVPASAELELEMRAAGGEAFGRGELAVAAAVRSVDAGASLPGDAGGAAPGSAPAAGPSGVVATACAEAVAWRQDGVSATVEERVRAGPWDETEDAARVVSVVEGVAAALGMGAARQRRGGLSDGNNLWTLAPTVDGMGPHGDGAHRAEERADACAERLFWPSLAGRAAFLAECVARVASGAGRS